MPVVNQPWFDRHDALLVAGGASAGAAIVHPDGQVARWLRNGGIEDPKPVLLEAGTRLVRYGGVGLPQTAMLGGWWLEFSEYDKARRLADRTGASVEKVLRQLCCLPLDWTQMEMVVQARLKRPLLAYRGASAPVLYTHRATGTTETYNGRVYGQDETIAQLFIPGMSSEEVQRQALALEGYGHVAQSLSRKGLILTPAGG